MTWPNTGTNNRKFLENIFTQKLLQDRKLREKIILENVLGVIVSVKYFNASKTDGGTKTLVFFIKSHIPFLLKNGKYRTNYHKHKTCEILNCDMTKALEQDFSGKKTLFKLV